MTSPDTYLDMIIDLCLRGGLIYNLRGLKTMPRYVPEWDRSFLTQERGSDFALVCNSNEQLLSLST